MCRDIFRCFFTQSHTVFNITGTKPHHYRISVTIYYLKDNTCTIQRDQHECYMYILFACSISVKKKNMYNNYHAAKFLYDFIPKKKQIHQTGFEPVT